MLDERKKRKKKMRNSLGEGAFFPGLDIPCWLFHSGFLWLLGAIKSSFKGRSLNFIRT
jgi:hypothetical protein